MSATSTTPSQVAGAPASADAAARSLGRDDALITLPPPAMAAPELSVWETEGGHLRRPTSCRPTRLADCGAGRVAGALAGSVRQRRAVTGTPLPASRGQGRTHPDQQFFGSI